MQRVKIDQAQFRFLQKSE